MLRKLLPLNLIITLILSAFFPTSQVFASPQAVTSTPTPARWITVTAPNGGETLHVGDVYRITWQSSSNIDKIYIGYKGCPSCLSWIATNIPNTGYYDWTVLVGNTSNTQFTIQITGYQTGFGSATDRSDAAFTVPRPPTPTRTPTKTFTPSRTPTATITETPSTTATTTNTSTDTAIPTLTHTVTPTFTPTDTPIPTDTETATLTSIFTHTATGIPADTETATPTLFTPTDTPIPTDIPTDTETTTLTSTFTHTVTSTPTDTETVTHTFTPTDTPIPTNTPTNAETVTPTSSPTETETITPTDTETPITTFTFTTTATRTITPTRTVTRTRTVTPTIPTSTLTVTKTATRTVTPTWTVTRTRTVTPTRTVTLTRTATRTATSTPTATLTDTPSPSPWWITVVAPNGGEELSYGDVYPITWQSSLGIDHVDIVIQYRYTCAECSPDWVFEWGISEVPNTGSYDWTVHVNDPTNKEFLVYVAGYDVDHTMVMGWDLSDEPFTVALSQVPTFTPTSTDIYIPTETGTFTVTPTDTATPTATRTMTVTATLPTPTSTPTRTATRTATFTSTNTLTRTVTPTRTRTITPTRTVTRTATLTTTYTPTITPTYTPPPTPWVTVIAPNGGEELLYGDIYRITWDASPVIATVEIVVQYRYTCVECSSDWVFEWGISDVPNTGSYDWTVYVDDPTNKEFLVYVGGYHSDYPTVLGGDLSDEPFTVALSEIPTLTPTFTPVYPPTVTPTPTQWITVIAPNGGEVLINGNVYPVTWQSSADIDYMYVVIGSRSVCSGCSSLWDVEWYTDLVPNTGSYDWTVDVGDPTDKEYIVAVQGAYFDGTSYSGIGINVLAIDISDNSFIIAPGGFYIPSPTLTRTATPTRTVTHTVTPTKTGTPTRTLTLTPRPSD